MLEIWPGFQFCLSLFDHLGFSSGGGRCGGWWSRGAGEIRLGLGWLIRGFNG